MFSDRFGWLQILRLFGPFRTVSDGFGSFSDRFGQFRIVFGRFWTVSDRFQSVSDHFRTVLDRFQTVSHESILNLKISNFNWPGLARRTGRLGGPQPCQLKFEIWKLKIESSESTPNRPESTPNRSRIDPELILNRPQIDFLSPTFRLFFTQDFNFSFFSHDHCFCPKKNFKKYIKKLIYKK